MEIEQVTQHIFGRKKFKTCCMCKSNVIRILHIFHRHNTKNIPKLWFTHWCVFSIKKCHWILTLLLLKSFCSFIYFVQSFCSNWFSRITKILIIILRKIPRGAQPQVPHLPSLPQTALLLVTSKRKKTKINKTNLKKHNKPLLNLFYLCIFYNTLTWK